MVRLTWPPCAKARATPSSANGGGCIMNTTLPPSVANHRRAVTAAGTRIGFHRAAFRPISIPGCRVAPTQCAITAFQISFSNPLICVAKCRIVAGAFGAHRRRLSPSKPSNTCIAANSDIISTTCVSNDNLPCSINSIAAILQITLVNENAQNTVVAPVLTPNATR